MYFYAECDVWLAAEKMLFMFKDDLKKHFT